MADAITQRRSRSESAKQSPMARSTPWGELSVDRNQLFTSEPVHRLPEEVGVAVVPRVLIDHMDSIQRRLGARPEGGCAGPTVSTRRSASASATRKRDRATVACQSAQSCSGGVLGGRVPIPVGVGAPFHHVPQGLPASPMKPPGQPGILHTGQMLEQPTQSHRQDTGPLPQADRVQPAALPPRVTRWKSRNPKGVAVTSLAVAILVHC